MKPVVFLALLGCILSGSVQGNYAQDESTVAYTDTSPYVTDPSTEGPTTYPPSTLVPTRDTDAPTTTNSTRPEPTTGRPVVSTTEGDWGKCANGSDLIGPPECPEDDPDHPVYFPFPYFCDQYFECTNGNAKCIKCPEGTIWDQTLKVCNHPSVVNCTIVTTPVPTTPTPTTPTTTPTTTTPTTTTPTTTIPTTTTTTTTTTTEPPTTEDEIINWICPENYIGLIRHPYDCKMFYNCAPPRRPCRFVCPNDLYFNPITDWCDFPANVPDCVDGAPPPMSTTPATGSRADSPNYRTISRSFNGFAQGVKYLTSFFERKQVEATTESSDPCENIRRRLEF